MTRRLLSHYVICVRNTNCAWVTDPDFDMRRVSKRFPSASSEPAVVPGFARATAKRKPDSGHGYIAAASSP